MVRLSHERVLVIGDVDRQMYSAVTQAIPTAQIKSVPNLFDGIAELSQEKYTTVLASVEPMERRPEAAVRTLRELSGDGKLLLFGHPTLEPLSQKMMEFGCDDYLITPVSPGELLDLLGAAAMRLRPSEAGVIEKPSDAPSPLAQVSLTDVVLDALVDSPQDPVGAIVARAGAALPPTFSLLIAAPESPVPTPPQGSVVVSHPASGEPAGEQTLHLSMPVEQDRAIAAGFLAQLSSALSKVKVVRDRMAGLQRMAITDDLTGLANGRYFKQFLSQVIERAKARRFPVTLFFFDIDNFKRYNDQYGHGIGDDILRQTANLMRRCVRDHDLVARISGDEFAVVFWDKDGPRTPRDPRPGSNNRTPQEPLDILDRFRRLLSTQDFPGLGPGGKGCLTISGGLAVYPYDAHDTASLIEAADHQLMFGAKRSGRNSIRLVGGDCLPLGNQLPEIDSGQE
jgi:GGDEF domain-containing protein